MRKAIRITFWILALFVVVSALAVTALFMFADPNKLKPVLTSEVLQRTGYKVVIDGDLSWSVYPKLGVKADGLTVTAPKQDAPFLNLKRVNIALEPAQLIYGTRKLSGEVHVADVRLMNVHATSALVGLHWSNKKLTLRPVKASLYGGSLSGIVSGANFAKTPAWSWDTTLSHVDVGALLKDVNGEDAKLRLDGNGQVRINATTEGLNAEQMLSNMNGSADFSLTNGALQGVDLNYLLQAADALINKNTAAAPENTHETAFGSLVGSALITSGVAQTNNLKLTSSVFQVKGQGSYNLPHQIVDMALQVESLKLNTRWEVPILVTGDITKPDVSLDMREINKMLAARELSEVKTRVKEKIKDHVPGKAGEYLQNLIGE